MSDIHWGDGDIHMLLKVLVKVLNAVELSQQILMYASLPALQWKVSEIPGLIAKALNSLDQMGNFL